VILLKILVVFSHGKMAQLLDSMLVMLDSKLSLKVKGIMINPRPILAPL
jgi:hypothetical protein